jgi:hypothetical protein
MFIGHYGVALGAKALVPEAPLPLLMLGTQVIDVVFATLVLAGVEKAEIDPNNNPTVPLKTTYIPYSHSLPAALLLSAVFGLAAAPFVTGYTATIFWTLALVAFSHWLLDLIVHTPDLPLIGNRMKVGFGLWNNRRAAIALEFVVILAGVAMLAGAGIVSFWKLLILTVVMCVIQTMSFFRPPPPTTTKIMITMLTVYGLMTLLGWWLDA